MLFPNPAVRILEERLWGAARKRYLQDHPNERNADAKTIMKKARTSYKDSIAASVKEADHKIRSVWSRFRHGMTEQVQTNLRLLLRMSDVDWYAVEMGGTTSPEVIAVPCGLLQHMTASLLLQSLRKGIEFEDLDDETLEALATYAVGQRFEEVLEHARRQFESFEIGEQHTYFAIAEVIPEDAYYFGEEEHHSKVNTVILANIGSAPDKKKAKTAVKKWLHEGRKSRTNDRRFTGDGWEVDFEELKSWSTC